jgi:hypothetical protein
LTPSAPHQCVPTESVVRDRREDVDQPVDRPRIADASEGIRGDGDSLRVRISEHAEKRVDGPRVLDCTEYERSVHSGSRFVEKLDEIRH